MTGIYADLIANASAWDSGNGDGSVGKDRVINMQIDRYIAMQGGDVEAAAAFEQADEIQTIATFAVTVTSGNYTLTLNIGGTSVTTANIVYNASAATIETAIDTVCTGNVTDWTNGDVTVACTDNMSANTVTLTYDGDAGSATNIPIVTITDVDLKGGSTGAVSTAPQGVVPVDEVNEIAIFKGLPTSGNYTLTINWSGESAVTTANLVYNANAATIETAIDVVCTGNITSWVNGDISVACTDNLTANVVTLTYDGTSVTGANHTAVVITDVDLAGGGVGAVTETLAGVVPVNEVQELAVHTGTPTGGNFTITINFSGESAVTTANIIFDDNAATIETAIDTVCTGNIAGWVNSDISVACTDNLTANVATFTYDGTSTAGANHAELLANDVDMSGGGTTGPGAPSTTTPGVLAVDEAQSLAEFPASTAGGVYTINLNLVGPLQANTANIAFDAVAATIETAIDTVCTGNVGGWTNGDITVAGGPMSSGAVTLTFNGDSVDELDHSLTTVYDVNLTQADRGGAVSTSPQGVVAVDEIHSIAVFPVTVTSGNYTLTINVAGEAAVTTANIVYTANAATIEGIVNTACAGFGGWTNGDITISGGPLSTNAVVLTFDGNSVDEANHTDTIINDADLKGGTPATPAVGTSGQTARRALAALAAVGAITSSPPPQGTTSGIVAVSRPANPHLPAPATLKALALQAAIDDSTDSLYTELMSQMGLTHLL